jgi:hypothetical protein
LHDVLSYPWYLQVNKINWLYDSGFLPLMIGKEKHTLAKDKAKKILENIDCRMTLKFPMADIILGKKETEKTWQRFSLVIERLSKAGNLIDLSSDERQLVKSDQFVYFSGTANFMVNEKDPKVITMKGSVRNCNFFCNCSEEWFTGLSRSLLRTLLDAHELVKDKAVNIFFVGSIVNSISSFEELLVLNPIYIGGDTEEIITRYKNL